MSPIPRRVRNALVAGLLFVLAMACSEPTLTQPPPPTDDSDEILTADILDPTRDELLVALADLGETLGAARDQLAVAAGAEDIATVRRATARALALLLDDPDTAADRAAVFPSRSVERSESAAQGDLLSSTLALARESGGTLGRATVEVLRDPVAGDLGAWERDAEGVVAATAAAVTGGGGGVSGGGAGGGVGGGVDAVADAVRALPADGVRALAWTLLADSTDDLEVARQAAERATGHLGVVLITLELLDEDAP